MINSLRPQDITFILVRPRYPGNIGSTARALKNMGFTKLSLVLPAVLPSHPEALRLAVGAADLLKKAKVYDSIESATKGLHFLVGTSRRTGKYRNDFILLPELAERLPQKQKIGILFGAEERGLTNKELAFCNLVATIPSNPDFASLNLAQSIAVVSYQLRLALLENQPKTSSSNEGEIPMADMKEMEGMYEHLEKALKEIHFLPDNDSFHIMRSVRQLFGRTRMTAREVRIFRGICRQVLWAAHKTGL